MTTDVTMKNYWNEKDKNENKKISWQGLGWWGKWGGNPEGVKNKEKEQKM